MRRRELKVGVKVKLSPRVKKIRKKVFGVETKYKFKKLLKKTLIIKEIEPAVLYKNKLMVYVRLEGAKVQTRNKRKTIGIDQLLFPYTAIKKV